MNDFDTALNAFLATIQGQINAHFAKHLTNL